MKANATLTDQLRNTLESEITSGKFRPGDRIEIGALARQFNVSRTPVREALIQLSSLGFVEMRPHSEVRVTRLTMQAMLDAFEVLADLEGLAAELAARRMNEDDRERILSLHAVCGDAVGAPDPSTFYDQNIRFHEGIHRAARNPFLENTIQSIRRRVSLYRRLRIHQRTRREQSWKEHDLVLKAIMAGDPDRARQSMRAHIAMHGDMLQDFIAALPASYFS